MNNLQRRYAQVLEGQCPDGHGALERRDDHGWCDDCKMGWSIRGDEITAHFTAKASASSSSVGGLTFSGGPAKVWFTSKVTS